MFDVPNPAAADRVALQFPDRSLTYQQLDRAAAALAASLAGARCVAIIAENRIETCVAVVAAIRAAVPAVPLNPRSGTAELAHIVADAAPDAVLTAPGTEPPPALAAAQWVPVELDHDRPPPPTRNRVTAGPDDPALIVYTSGTTGPPKGALLPRRAIATNLDALSEIWEWTERDVVAHALPLFHVHGLVVGILGPLRRGGRALHLGRFDPAAVGAALAGDATMLFGVPTMYRRLADAATDDPGLAAALGRARLLVSGSAALPGAEHERLTRLTGRSVLERYGMTETLMNTGIRISGRAAPGTVGPPLPGVELRLVDDDGHVVSGEDDETIGEIQVRGPNLFLGYLNRPDATAAAFTHDGWFITGDVATRGAGGYIRLVGRRATDLIKSGGYKIGAGEIEAALREHPAVLDAAVTGEPDDDLGERLVAWVVLTDRHRAPPDPDRDRYRDRDRDRDRDRLAAELVDHVATLLAPHKRPRIVHFLDDLPRNDLGKVQKRRLIAPGSHRASPDPRTPG
jgi:malonyl-CoA/methylmalonyl-CoA synthetase